MSKIKLPRIPKVLLTELEGLDWALHLRRRHFMLTIDDKFIAILPRGVMSECANKNNLSVRSAVRRYKQSRYVGFSRRRNFENGRTR
jgi:hypothetical protein